MPNVIQGDFAGKSRKIGIVVSRFNEFISSKLLDGALDGLKRHGVADEDITVAWTPGAFEIPLIARKMAEAKKYDAVIALGCVIRGATPHFDYVAGEAAKGVGQAGLSTGVPVIFGVLTGTKSGNKGFDSAMAALEMANLLRKL